MKDADALNFWGCSPGCIDTIVKAKGVRMANRTFVTLAAVVGFASAVVGLAQAFSFTHLRRIECHHSDPALGQRDVSGAMLPCLRDIQDSVDGTVLLDWETYVAEDRTNQYGELVGIPFDREVEDGSVSFQFDYASVALEAATTVGDTQNSEEAFSKIDHLLSSDGYSVREAYFLSDNGIALTIYTNGGAGSNPFSVVELGRWGGADSIVDQATGPFQVTLLTGDARHYRLSPAPVTDDLAREVRCARREWPDWMKFFVCPFV